MKTSFFQHTPILRALGLLGFISILGFVAHTAFSKESDVSPVTTQPARALYTPQSVSTLPYAVSGIVEASDDAVVRAETAGVIQNIGVVEGDVVERGVVVLQQNVSVLDSQIALGHAQGALSSLVQNGSVIQGTAAEISSGVLKQSASTSLTLTQKSIAIGVEDTTKLLATQLQASVLELVAALDFIDTNRSYFPKESTKLYNETVGALYGTQPSYLGNSFLYGVSSHDDILDILESLKEESTLDTNELLRLSQLVDKEIGTASTMFFNAENDFFDEKVVDVDSEKYTTYLNHRRALVGSATGLETVMATLQNALNTGALNIHGQDTQVALSEINSSTATDALQNIGAIYTQTGVVSDAQLGVLYAQRSLGAPRAAFRGVVAEIYVTEGEYVTPGTPLIKIVGDGARELSVRVPASMLPFLKEGLSFVVTGEVQGFVSHFAPVLTDGSIEVFIELSDTASLVGDSLEGTIMFDIDSTLFVAIPRSHLFFDSKGPFVRTATKSHVPVQIVYDLGETLYVRSSGDIVTKLLPAIGIVF